MAKQIKQFRYYGNNSNKNYPNDLNQKSLASGNAFNQFTPILQLGIQSLPGTKIYLNESNGPIVIGYTGIYELDIDGLAEITKIQIDNESLKTINDRNSSYLIIDIIYEDGEN